MEYSEHHINNIIDLKKTVDEISGIWNGDESGSLEERAMVANDISNKCDEILKLIKELN